MGIDFAIENSPRLRVNGRFQGYYGDEQHYDNALIRPSDLPDLGEPKVIDLHITLAPLVPELPEDVAKLHCSWAYSGFMRFRQRVAATIGVDLEMMEGFGGDTTVMSTYKRAHGLDDRAIYSGDYQAVKDAATEWWESTARCWAEIGTPLEPFLHHSDCDGEMTPAECAQVAPALREAVENLQPLKAWATARGVGPDAPVMQGQVDHWDDRDRQGGLVLVQMMEACAKYGRDLLFR